MSRSVVTAVHRLLRSTKLLQNRRDVVFGLGTNLYEQLRTATSSLLTQLQTGDSHTRGRNKIIYTYTPVYTKTRRTENIVEKYLLRKSGTSQKPVCVHIDNFDKLHLFVSSLNPSFSVDISFHEMIHITPQTNVLDVSYQFDCMLIGHVVVEIGCFEGRLFIA
jgi:hypothetical protein